MNFSKRNTNHCTTRDKGPQCWHHLVKNLFHFVSMFIHTSYDSVTWDHKYKGCVFVSVSLSSDSTICEWSPVQYPVYSLCETGSQRDGEIAEMSSPAWRKQTQFVFCSAFVSLLVTNTASVQRKQQLFSHLDTLPKYWYWQCVCCICVILLRIKCNQ